MFQTALRWLARTTRPATPAATAAGLMLGYGLTERELRFGLERNNRVLATLEENQRARCALIDQANAVRPWTLL